MHDILLTILKRSELCLHRAIALYASAAFAESLTADYKICHLFELVSDLYSAYLASIYVCLRHH